MSLPGFDVPSLVAALDLAASGDDASDEDDDLWTRICQEHDQYWTATGRPKRDRNAKQAALETAQSRVSELEQQLISIDRDADQNETPGDRRAAACLDPGPGPSSRRDELSERVDMQRSRLRDKVEHLTSASDAAKLKRDSIESEQQRRHESDRRAVDSRDRRTQRARSPSHSRRNPPSAAAIRHVEQTGVALAEAASRRECRRGGAAAAPKKTVTITETA